MSTFIGKILVIVITCVSLLFLGISTVAYSTAQRLAQGRRGRADQGRWAQEEAPGGPARGGRRQEGPRRRQGSPGRRDQEPQCPARRARRRKQTRSRSRSRGERTTAHRQRPREKLLEEVQAKREQIDQLHKQQAAVDQASQRIPGSRGPAQRPDSRAGTNPSDRRQKQVRPAQRRPAASFRRCCAKNVYCTLVN